MKGWLRSKLSIKPDPQCPVCFGSGTQHCGMAACRGGRCGEPCDCLALRK